MHVLVLKLNTSNSSYRLLKFTDNISNGKYRYASIKQKQVFAHLGPGWSVPPR